VRVHRGKAILAGIAAIALGLTACSSSGGGGSSNTSGTKGTGILADCGKNPNTCNTGDTKPGGTFTYTLEKVIYGWNVNSGNSSTFEQVEVLDGLLPADAGLQDQAERGLERRQADRRQRLPVPVGHL
jgi:peptide/nickel transport system substrate-binding protein